MPTRPIEIKDMTVPWLLQELRRGEKTGTAIFEQDSAIKKIYFEQGDVLFASSNLVEDRLGEFLVRKGKITRDQLDEALRTAEENRRKLGAILHKMGALNAHELVDQLKLQVREIVLSLFGWRGGRCWFDPAPVPGMEIIPLQMSIGNLIFDGVRTIDREFILASLPPRRTIVRPSTDPLLLFQDAHLPADQQKVRSLIDGGRCIEEVCSLSEIGAEETLHAIYMLLALRMIETGGLKPEGEQKPAGETARQAVVAATGTKSALSEHAVTKEQLRIAHDNLQRQNHYEVLGIGRSAAAPEIRKTYLSLAKLYHPDQHFRPEMNDMQEQLAELFHAIHEAYDTLTDRTKRDRYDRELAGGGAKRRSVEHRPDNRSRAAEKYREGMALFDKGNFWAAEEAFEWAMRFDPRSAEYLFHRGLALSRMPQRGGDAEEYLVQAIGLAPATIEYYLELGRFYMKYGLATKARAVYQDAMKRAPDPGKVLQAMRDAGIGRPKEPEHIP